MFLFIFFCAQYQMIIFCQIKCFQFSHNLNKCLCDYEIMYFLLNVFHFTQCLSPLSPSQGTCCSKNCSMAVQRGDVCRSQTECQEEAVCSGYPFILVQGKLIQCQNFCYVYFHVIYYNYCLKLRFES